MSESPPAVRVVWTGPLEARIETLAGNGDEPVERALVFRAEDPERDRWRALGLVVAALLVRQSAEPVAAPSPPRPPRKEVWPALWIDGGGVIGRGLDPGPASFGGFLRGGYRFPSTPMFLGVGASYAAAGKGPTGLEAAFTSFSLGAGAVVRVPDAALAIRPRLDALLNQVVVEGSSGGPAGATSGSRRLGGFGAAVEAAWPATARLSLVLGAEGAFLSGATAIRFGDVHAAASPALTYRFLLGIQGIVLP